MKYIISYNTKFGSVSVESKDPEDLVTAYPVLQDLAGRITKTNGKETKNARKEEKQTSGMRETAIILRELESGVLPSKFFSQPRTTGETREELHEITGKYFT